MIVLRFVVVVSVAVGLLDGAALAATPVFPSKGF